MLMVTSTNPRNEYYSSSNVLSLGAWQCGRSQWQLSSIEPWRCVLTLVCLFIQKLVKINKNSFYLLPLLSISTCGEFLHPRQHIEVWLESTTAIPNRPLIERALTGNSCIHASISKYGWSQRQLSPFDHQQKKRYYSEEGDRTIIVLHLLSFQIQL